MLALLREKPEHGYGLHRRLQGDDLLSRVWTIRQSQVYFLLSKLVRRRWVHRQRKGGGQGPPRAEFEITPAGRAALRRWMKTPVRAPRELRGAFAAKLYFTLLSSSPPAARSLVARQRSALRSWLTRHREGLPRSGPAAAVLRLRDVQTEAALTYLDRLEPSVLLKGKAGKKGRRPKRIAGRER